MGTRISISISRPKEAREGAAEGGSKSERFDAKEVIELGEEVQA